MGDGTGDIGHLCFPEGQAPEVRKEGREKERLSGNKESVGCTCVASWCMLG